MADAARLLGARVVFTLSPDPHRHLAERYPEDFPQLAHRTTGPSRRASRRWSGRRGPRWRASCSSRPGCSRGWTTRRGPPILLYVGRLHLVKQQTVLVRAWLDTLGGATRAAAEAGQETVRARVYRDLA